MPRLFSSVDRPVELGTQLMLGASTMKVAPTEQTVASRNAEAPTGTAHLLVTAEQASTMARWCRAVSSLTGKFAYQTRALSFKSSVSLWRSPLWSLVYCGLPLLCAFALASLSNGINSQAYPPSGGVTLKLTKCKVFNVYGRIDDARSCATVAWAPSGDATAAAVMARLAKSEGFTVGTDLSSSDVVTFESSELLARALLQNPGQIDGAVVFTNTTGTEVAYELLYNRTALAAYANLKRDAVGGYFKVSGRSLALQQAVDAAIVGELAASKPQEDSDASGRSADLSIAVDSFPQKLSSSFLLMLGVPSVVPWLGPTFCCIGFATQALMVTSRLVGEKESGVIFTLRRMGLMEAAHWFSWFLVLAVLNLASAALVALLAPLLVSIDDVSLFARTSPGVLWLLWFFASCGHTALACFLAAATPARYLEHVSALLAVLVVGFTFVMSSLNLYAPAIGSWQMERQPNFSPVGSFVFFWWPFFHFSRAFDLVSDVTETSGDAPSGEEAQHYSMNDLSDRGEREAFDQSNPTKIQYFEPEGVSFALAMLALSSASYLVLAWYAGQLFSGEGSGPSKPFWFPFSPSYWGFHGHDNRVVYEGDVAAREQWLSRHEKSIHVHKLSVSYGKVQALRETTFSFAPGQIWALLGHNGAGKSTLINVLSGLIQPTFGHAFVRGLDVAHEMASLQALLGTCPQHDTLFPSLTGREHLEVYCTFKGLLRGGKSAARDEVNRRLEDVDLLASADVLAAHYSGGMKRRLSVAMAAIGEPQILIYDEPTTGMDPVVRRKIWRSIEKLKAGRLILLTTHSMEEADFLGDRVAVLHEGRMRAQGTSLELKAKYGKGYQLSMLGETGGGSELLKSALAEHFQRDLPGSELHFSGGGQLRATLPRHTLRHLPRFFKSLKDDAATLGHLDWGVSNSTLEDVFLRLVAMDGANDGAHGVSPSDDFVDLDPEMVAFALDAWAATVHALPNARRTTAADVTEAVAAATNPRALAESGVVVADARRRDGSHSLGDVSGHRKGGDLKSSSGSGSAPKSRSKRSICESPANANDSDNGNDNDTAWLLQGTAYLKGPQGRQLEPVVWRPSSSSMLTNSTAAKQDDPPEGSTRSSDTPHAVADGATSTAIAAAEIPPKPLLHVQQPTSETVMCKIVVPDGAPPNSLLSVEVLLPSGKVTVHVTVPPNVSAGEAITVSVTPPTLVPASAVAPTEDADNRGASPVIHSLSDVPMRASATSQLDGVLRKSLAIQSTRRCFNWCSCCCVGFAVLLSWLFSLVQPVAVPISGSNCSTFDFTVAAPALCNEQDLVTWTSGRCPSTSANAQKLDESRGLAFGLPPGEATSPGAALFSESAEWPAGQISAYGQLFLRRYQEGFDPARVSSLVYFIDDGIGGPWGVSGCCPAGTLLLAHEAHGVVSRTYCWRQNSTTSNNANHWSANSDATWLIDAAAVPYPLQLDRNWSTFWSWVESEMTTALRQPSPALRRTPSTLESLALYAVQQQHLVLAGASDDDSGDDDDDGDGSSSSASSLSSPPAELFVLGSATAEISPRFPVTPGATSPAQGAAAAASLSSTTNVFSETQKLEIRDSTAAPYSAFRAAAVPANSTAWWWSGDVAVEGSSGAASFGDFLGASGRQVPDVRAAVLASQAAMFDRMVDEVPFGAPSGNAPALAPVTCAGIAAYAWHRWDEKWPNKRGVVENDRPEALFAEHFPNFGLEIHQSSLTAATAAETTAPLSFHATLLFYGFGWTSTSWPYARVFAERTCADGTLDECCDVYEVAAPRDWVSSSLGGESDGGGAPNSACDRVNWDGEVPYGREPVLDLRLPSALSSVSNALLRASTAGGVGSIRTSLVAMPSLCFTPALAPEAVGWQLFFVPFIVSFLLPPFAVMLTAEKTLRLYHGMTVKGMASSLYWFANWAYGSVLFGGLGLAYCGLAQLMQIQTVLNCSWGLLLLLTFAWAHAQTMLAFFLAGVAHEPRAVAIIVYLVLFVTAIAGGVINSPGQSFEPYPWQLLLFPNFAYSRALSLCLLYGGATVSGDLSQALLWLCAVSTALGAVGILVHRAKASPLYTLPYNCVLPSAVALAGAALLPATHGNNSSGSSSRRGHCSKDEEGEDREAGDVEMRVARPEGEGEGDEGSGDGFVDAAAEEVQSGRAALDPRTCVLLEGFTRVYAARSGAPPKVAVSDVNLAIQYGETFGLLGPNGAGKTTLLETLSGLTIPQHGRALVGGVDIARERRRALGLLGVCPQFDVVWPELTVADHLLLYARLKGVTLAQQRAAATLAATKVSLDGDAFLLKSRELSGGMRRRLSIAAALVGEPKVVILDEPTTGLDPDTRQKIWSIIMAERRPNRAIILTTHSMEEADTLCSRIGIMAAGKLRALGTPQRLKSTYGTGFKLEVTVKPGGRNHAAAAEAFVQSLVKAERRHEVTSSKQVGDTATFALPRGAFDAAEALAELQARSHEHGILEWSLAQPSLEEVFVNIANKYTRD